MIEAKGKDEKLLRAVRRLFTENPATSVEQARSALGAAVANGALDHVLADYAAAGRQSAAVVQEEVNDRATPVEEPPALTQRRPPTPPQSPPAPAATPGSPPEAAETDAGGH